MFKLVLLVLLCLRAFPSFAGELAGSVQLADGQMVTNQTILGPDQDLLPPFVATQALEGQDYFEWCLRWNKLQDALAEQRTIPPRTIRGHVSSYQAYSEGHSGGYRFWGNAPAQERRSFYSTRRSHEEVWEIGGYAGGPVTLYNPFVKP